MGYTEKIPVNMETLHVDKVTNSISELLANIEPNGKQNIAKRSQVNNRYEGGFSS